MDCSPWDSPGRILEWVAMPSSRGSSQLRDWTCVSCIAGGLFTTKLPGKTYTYIQIFTYFDIVLEPCENLRNDTSHVSASAYVVLKFWYTEYSKKKKNNPNFFYICLFQIRIRLRYTCCKCESEAEWCTRNSQRRRWGRGGFGFGGFILGGRGWRFRRGSGVNQGNKGQSQGKRLAFSRRRSVPLFQWFSKWGPQAGASPGN